MTKIKIIDLPRDMKISAEEMKKVTGGLQPYSGLLTWLPRRPVMTFKPLRSSLGPMFRGGWDARPGGDCEPVECG